MKPQYLPAAPDWVRRGMRIASLALSFALAALCIVGTSLWMNAPRASAHFIGNGLYIKGVGSENEQGFWLGALETANMLGASEPSFCITMWNASPSADSEVLTRTISAPSVQAAEELRVSTAEMAYLISRYFGQGDADSRAALAYLAHLNFEQETQGFDTVTSLRTLRDKVLAQHPHIDQIAQEYVAYARANTPREYSVGELVSDGFDGEVRNVGVRSATGWTPDIAVSARIEGPAHFTETAGETWDGRTSDTPISLPIQATGHGTVSVHITFEGVPRQTLTIASAGGRVQDLLTLAGRPDGEPNILQLQTNRVQMVTQFQPMIRTNVGESRLVDAGTGGQNDSHTAQASAKITDNVEVFLPEGSGQWPTVKGKPAQVMLHGRVYRLETPLNEALHEVPTQAQLIAETSMSVEGVGTYTAHIDNIEPGFVTWVWSIDKNDPAHDVLSDAGYPLNVMIKDSWSDAYGLVEETTSVRTTLNIDTSISRRETKSGVYLVDDLYVEGFPQGHGAFEGNDFFEADHMILDHDLYFFPDSLAVTDQNLENAQHIGHLELPARNGFHPSVGANDFKILDGNPAGTYVFVTRFSGDSKVAKYQSSVTDRFETIYVPPAASKEENPQLPPGPQESQPPALAEPQPPIVEETEPQPPVVTSAPPAGEATPPPQDNRRGLQSTPLPTPLAHTGAKSVVITLGVAGLLASTGLMLRSQKE